MKYLLIILIFWASYFVSHAQIKYSTEAKTFIDFDTAIIALRHALLIDGNGVVPKTNQTVILINGKIDWIGDDAKATIPGTAQVIDLKGKALMPGFVMLHEHMFMRYPEQQIVKQMPISFPRLYLACGVTTGRTAHSNDPYADISIKKGIDNGTIAGPALYLTAPLIDGPKGLALQMQKLSTPAQAIQHVNYWGDQGFTSFKVHRTIEKPVLKAAIETAHQRKLKLTGHLCSITHREAADLGIDHLEHGFMDCTDFVPDKKENECPTFLAQRSSLARLDLGNDSVKSLIKLLVNKKISITSTLAVFEGFHRLQPTPRPEMLEMLTVDQRDNYLKVLSRTQASTTEGQVAFDKAFFQAAKLEKRFYDAGGLIAVGTDPTGNGGTIAGFGSWRAIELLVEAGGFSPLEALKIATRNGAIVLGIERNTGTIETGKEADLLVIDGDPSKNISDIRKIVWVFKDGVGFNSSRMIESVKGKVGYY